MKSTIIALSLAIAALALPTHPQEKRQASTVTLGGKNQTVDGTLDLVNDDSLSVGDLQVGGNDGNPALFDGTMNTVDDEGLVHGPMIIGGEDGPFQGDLTVAGDAGVIQGDMGLGGDPTLRLSVDGDRGTTVGVGNTDIIGGQAANGGDGQVDEWDQDLNEYRSSTSAAAAAAATATATSTATAQKSGLLGLGVAGVL